MKNSQDHFNVLRKIQNKPQASQREIAKELGFSLGKLNYCLKALQLKGLVKIKNLKKKKDKLKYVKNYVLTPKGIAERTKLTIDFMKRKMSEYDELKKEIKNIYVDSSKNQE
jgi:EPS-associated MarR family transcriptional regulator|tara:strand:+ start:256 stop:591 length:336 start_codon:yes stop_codon:yes gene_type:complete